MRDRTQQHHRIKANLISIAVLFIFYLLTPIKTYADQPTPTSLEIQQTTVGIKGKVLANSDYDVIIPIDTYYKVIFDSTGGSAVSMQFVKENCNAIEPAAPTRANYEFNFWVEKGTYEEFNFTTTPITHDITLKAVWTSTSPSDENKPNTDKEDTNSSEDTKDTTDDKEGSSDNKDENTESTGENSETKDKNNDTKDKSSESNGEDNKSSESNESNNDLSNTSEENTETNNENTDESTETTDESNDNSNGLINTLANQSNQSNQSIETDPDIATNTETTDLISEIKATVLGVFKTIKTSITIVAKISLIGILIWFIWFIILINNTLVKIQAPSEDHNDQNQPDQPDQPDQSQSWKTVYLTPIKKTIEQTVGDKRTIWSLSLPQNILDDNKELKVKIPWSVYHRAEDTNQANQTELHITIVNQDQSLPTPTIIYIITNETKEIKIK